MPRSKDAIRRAQRKYEASGAVREVTKDYHLKCHTVHDADVIATLEAKDNKSGYIKTLIRADIERQG